MPCRRCIRSLLLLLPSLSGGPAHALDPALSLGQLHHTRWSVREGAPPDGYAMAQTTDGALWLGTPIGLYRFDGVRFERFKAPQPAFEQALGDVASLLATADGGLWIGSRYGGAYLLRAGRFAAPDSGPSLPAGRSVFTMLSDREGRLWAGTTDGLWRREGSGWQRVPIEPASRSVFVHHLQQDRGGTLWVSTTDGLRYLPAGASRFETWPAVHREGYVAPTPGGTVWYSGEPALFSLVEATRQTVPATLGWRPKFGTGPVLADRDGGLWFAQLDGLGRVPVPERAGPPAADGLPAQAQRFGMNQGLSGHIIRTMLEDRDGNIWLATNGGIDRFRAPRLTRIDQPELFDLALADGPAGGAAGGLWAASGFFGLLHLAQPLSARPRFFPELGKPINAILAADGGVLWVGGVPGLWHSNGRGGFVRVAAPAEAMPVLAVQAMAQDGAGDLWVSFVRAGLFRYRNGRWQANGGFTTLPRTVPNYVYAMHRDPHGGLWLGYADNHVARLAGDSVMTLAAAQGLAVGNAHAFASDGERLWIGGTKGLAVWSQGRLAMLRGTDDEPFDGISGMVVSADGALWLNGLAGISRLAPTELARATVDPSYRMAYRRFDHQDGLLGVATQLRPQPSAYRAPDGSMWFSTGRGLFMLDPARLPVNPRPPSVEVSALVLDRQRLPPSHGLALPARTTQVRLDYTAPSLSIPERVRFRYRLDGVDDDWQEAGTRRQAFYTQLGPGNYVFRVKAANEDGVWNETPAMLAFTIAPTFFQTRGFLVLCGAAALAALWALHRLRLRQVQARLRSRLDERLQERERIARELHDTLLQSTQGLILSFQGLAERTPRGDPQRLRMEQLLARADQALAEGRQRVMDLRSPETGHHDLLQALARVRDEFAGSDTPPLHTDLQGLPQPLQPEVRDELYRLGREALRNAFAHAGARRIDLTLVFGPRELVLRVADDGRGIAPDLLAAGAREGHWGLTGMHERAQKLGTRLALESTPGGGTTVTLRIDLASARNSRRPGLLARLRRWWAR